MRATIDFFANGHFFMPLAIFSILWFITDLAGTIIFQLPNMCFENWLKRKLNSISEKDLAFFDNPETETKEGPATANGNWFTETMIHLRKSMNYEKIKRNINVSRNRLRMEFVLIFRLFLLMTIYFVTLDYFSGGWYFLLTLGVIMIGLRASFAYQFIEIRLTFIEKVDRMLIALEGYFHNLLKSFERVFITISTTEIINPHATFFKNYIAASLKKRLRTHFSISTTGKIENAINVVSPIASALSGEELNA